MCDVNGMCDVFDVNWVCDVCDVDWVCDVKGVCDVCDRFEGRRCKCANYRRRLSLKC